MPTHDAIVRNTLCNAAVDAVDGGTLVFEDATNTAVATLTFATPAFGDATAGTATLLGTPLEDTNATGGDIDHYAVYNSSAALQWTGTVTVTGGGGEIEIDQLTIPAGSTVRLTSYSYTSSP